MAPGGDVIPPGLYKRERATTKHRGQQDDIRLLAVSQSRQRDDVLEVQRRRQSAGVLHHSLDNNQRVLHTDGEETPRQRQRDAWGTTRSAVRGPGQRQKARGKDGSSVRVS